MQVEDLSDRVAGVALAGPASHDLLAKVADSGLADLGFLRAGVGQVAGAPAHVGRISVTGELGYELNVAAADLPTVYSRLREAGTGCDVGPFGFAALDALRMEKSYGIWSREFTWAYTPAMCGLDRFVDAERSFIGHEAFRREQERGPVQRLVTLEVDSTDAEAGEFDPIWSGDQRVGFVTSGAYGHTVGRSLALGYVDPACAHPGTELAVHVVGRRTPARVIPDSPHDPGGDRARR